MEAGNANGTSGDPLDFRALAARAFVAAASAVGFLGFVAALGGAILWVRYFAAQLPAEQAVAVLPKNELVSFGAVSLVIFVILGAAAVVAVYLINPTGGVTLDMEWGLIGLVAAEMALAIWTSPIDSLRKFLDTIVLVAGAVALAVLVWRRYREAAHAEAGERYGEELVAAEQRYRAAAEAAERIGFDPPAPVLVRPPAPPARTAAARPPLAGDSFGARAAVYAAALIFLVLLTAIAAPEWWVLIIMLIAALLGRACMRVSSITRDVLHKFAWYGIAVFLSVIFFGAAMTAIRALFLPLVQPAAVLREGDPNGVCGFYITETSDRIYLARSDLESDANRRPESNTGRIFWIPRKEVTALAIGRLQSVRNARRRAPLLRQELLAQRAPQFIARSESTDTTTEQTVADLKTTKKTSNSSKIPERVPDAASTAKSDTCSDVDF